MNNQTLNIALCETDLPNTNRKTIESDGTAEAILVDVTPERQK